MKDPRKKAGPAETKSANSAVLVVLGGQVEIYAVSPNKFRNKFKIKLSSWACLFGFRCFVSVAAG